MSDHSCLLAFWGKTKDRNPKAEVYHPLLFHLMDVAHAAQRLWRFIAPDLRLRVANALGVSEAEAERVVVLLAGLHDLGKASAFQYKAEHLWDNLRAQGLTIRGPNPDPPHAFVTAASEVLPHLLLHSTVCGWTTDNLKMAIVLSNITGAHHGNFPPTKQYTEDTRGKADWAQAREEMARLLAETLYHDEKPTENPVRIGPVTLEDAGVGAFLTGFIAVADWLGSNARFTPKTHLGQAPESVSDYKKQSEQVTGKLMDDLGWTPPDFAAPLPFEAVVWGIDKDELPIRFKPNNMQATVATLAEQAGRTPYLLIVEAAMGQGKTEAALYAADRGMTGGAKTGLYVALPTQATGNALFRRVAAYLKYRGHTGRLNLQLVHGAAEFVPDYEALRQEAFKRVESAQTNENGPPTIGVLSSRVVAESWFSSSKQALLAPFGVGTIDQTLMGVLQTKHWFVRLFGLAGKVVVFDEVHAYDVYMGRLLDTLVRWLAELGCTVILLSATLPRERREALLAAYTGENASPAPQGAPYPRVTFAPKGQQAVCRGVEQTEASRSVELTFLATKGADEWDTVATRLLDDLPNGGCAAILCNTVARAQAAFDALCANPAIKKAGWTVRLFHARTPLAWRQAREQEVLKRFDKNSTPGERNKQILIATQVVEQSLDLDFDWMASEIAPVDLLLQRMGRLHRHPKRDGERPVSVARIVVIGGQIEPNTDTVPTFPPGTPLVYETYVLLRTSLALVGKTQVSLPGDIEPLIEAVYDTGASELGPALATALAEARATRDNEANAAASIAAQNSIIKPPKDFAQVAVPRRDLDLADDDDPTLHETLRATTRLGDASVSLVCLRRDADNTLRPLCAPANAPIYAEDKEPDREMVRLLRESTVAVARPKGLFFELTHRAVPSTWANVSALRYARAVIFENGQVTVGPYTLLLHADAGLRIVKEAQHEADEEADQAKQAKKGKAR